MKSFVVAALALASLATAFPPKCKPATYRCSTNAGKPAWDVCNTSGVWEYAGDCPPNTVCKFDNANGSPYCVPPGFNL